MFEDRLFQKKNMFEDRSFHPWHNHNLSTYGYFLEDCMSMSNNDTINLTSPGLIHVTLYNREVKFETITFMIIPFFLLCAHSF